MPEDARSQFGPVAANYTRGAFHSAAERLREVVDLAQPRVDELAVDVATGTGHTALAIAPHVRRVVGVDFTPEMLAEAVKLAASRGVANADWVLADAQAMPFADATFDLYTVRAAPHHFLDIEQALRESARVLKPGGRACYVDCSAPGEAREALHEVEVLRDPSHIRSYTIDEWTGLIEAAGLVVEAADRIELDWDHDDWMNNMNVPAENRPRIAALIESSRGRAFEQLRPERRQGRLYHAYWHALIRARKPWR